MRLRYDPAVDALSVVFRETTVTTKELADGIVAEYDAENRLVGLEIVGVESRFGDRSTFREVVLEGVGLGIPRTGEELGSTR